MTNEQIKALQDAGISAETILELVLKLPEGQTETKPEAKAEAITETKPEENQEQAQTQEAAAEAAADSKAILAAIEKLTGAVLLGNNRSTGREGAEDVTSESALNFLINGKDGK